jgi:RNA polymerase-binding transcription factor DksA
VNTQIDDVKSRQQMTQIKERLLDRSAELRSDIQRELRKYDNETYGQIADRVADPAEQSVADLLSDINLAEIARDVAEFGDIEAALLRLAHGDYGICVDCEEPIEPDRLDSSPEVARCLRCQQAYERHDQKVQYRKL